MTAVWLPDRPRDLALPELGADARREVVQAVLRDDQLAGDVEKAIDLGLLDPQGADRGQLARRRRAAPGVLDRSSLRPIGGGRRQQPIEHAQHGVGISRRCRLRRVRASIEPRPHAAPANRSTFFADLDRGAEAAEEFLLRRKAPPANRAAPQECLRARSREASASAAEATSAGAISAISHLIGNVAKHLGDVVTRRERQRPECEIAGERIDVRRASGHGERTRIVEEDKLRHLAQQTERIIAIEEAVGHADRRRSRRRHRDRDLADDAGRRRQSTRAAQSNSGPAAHAVGSASDLGRCRRRSAASAAARSAAARSGSLPVVSMSSIQRPT